MKICDLSKREQEVLRLLAKGHTQESVGNQLGISTSTVKNHAHNIFLKTDTGTVIEALRVFYSFVEKQ